jgi:restriction system protein
VVARPDPTPCALDILQGVANGIGGIEIDIINWLGRRTLGCRASIPDILTAPFHGRKADPERDALESYAPKARVYPRLETVVFKDSTKGVFGPLPQATRAINIDELPNICRMSAEPSFESLWGVLNQKSGYLVRPPSKLPDTPAPPSWTPWHTWIPAPVFELPLYEGRLSFLNRFVHAAYKGEMDRVAAARIWKVEIEEATSKRNAQMEQLADKASALWEQVKAEQEQAFVKVMSSYNQSAKAYEEAAHAEQAQVRARWELTHRPGSDGLLDRIDLELRTMSLPDAVPREAESRLDIDSGVLIHEQRFPDLSDLECVKFVKKKAQRASALFEEESQFDIKPVNQKELKDILSKLYPAICLRLACEIVRLDSENIVKAVAINGWAEFTDKATGQRKRAYCASLFATKEQIDAINIAAVDPVAAFNKLKGITAHSLEVTPIAPIIRLDTNDPRFVDAKEILAHMADSQNLAAMNWEDFEHLCRELFERAFSSTNAEVKITQSSRDQGVDAIIFDPDPLRGGKILIQAKRYTNLVDVSAVRDLYGAVINEGAIKGILVTTSSYGPDSYSFAKDKPLTLLAGRELLGLLEQHGYKFRIDIAEAKRMMQKG